MLAPVAKLILRLGGWNPVYRNDLPTSAVLIAAPHTSNWDGFWGIVYKVAAKLDAHWFAKKSLFWFPLGTVLRAFGGIPLDRKRAGSAVDLAINMFETTEHFYFALAPEGTRSKLTHWKTGFYRIADRANVPVVLGFLDYGAKRIGLGPSLHLSGDKAMDLEALRSFYEDVEGRWPDKAGPIEFPKRKK